MMYNDTEVRDKDKDRSTEKQASLDRQRSTRERRRQESLIKFQMEQDLAEAPNSTRARRIIKQKAKEALEKSNADFEDTYVPPSNKQDYESDTSQRGIDTFDATDATPLSEPSVFDAIIAIDGKAFSASIQGEIGDEIP